MCVYIYTWRPDINLGCHSSGAVFLICLSVWHWVACWPRTHLFILGWLTSDPQGSTCLCLTGSGWHTFVYHTLVVCLNFTGAQGADTSCFQGEHASCWAVFPAPRVCVVTLLVLSFGRDIKNYIVEQWKYSFLGWDMPSDCLSISFWQPILTTVLSASQVMIIVLHL